MARRAAGLAVGHMLLSWRSGSMSSVSLVGVARGLAFRACAATGPLDFRAEPVLALANLWCSGIKMATRRANKTAQAPNRKGGPGMSARYNTEREKQEVVN